MRASATEAEFAELQTQLRGRAGKVSRSNVTGLSWYPTGSQLGTGVAAALDFHSLLPAKNQLCGYLAFIELSDNRFVLLRDDTTFVEPRLLSAMSGEQKRQLLDRPGCRHLLE